MLKRRCREINCHVSTCLNKIRVIQKPKKALNKFTFVTSDRVPVYSLPELLGAAMVWWDSTSHGGTKDLIGPQSNEQNSVTSAPV